MKKILNKNNTKLNMFELYTLTINSYKESVLNKNIHNDEFLIELDLVLNDLAEIVKYMLVTKNLQAKPKVKKEKKRINKDSIDLRLYMGEQVSVKDKKISNNINLLDIITLFKNLEGYMLRGTYLLDSFESLKLGEFDTLKSRLYNNLPKLLVSIYKLEDNYRKHMITLVFSAIRIYRSFKTKALPKTETITNKYTGESIASILENEFSDFEISE